MPDEAASAAGLQHAALLYRSPEELTSAAGPFVQHGAAADGAILVALPPPSLAILSEALGGFESSVTVIDMADAGANPGRLIPLLHTFARSHAGQSLRILQEPAWPSRSRPELAEVIKHEMLLSLALAGLQVQVLCPYSADLPADVLAGAMAAHPAVAGQDGWTRNLAYQRDVPGDDRNWSLDPPPPGAPSMTYRAEQSEARKFAAEQARLAGVTERRVVDVIIAVGELTGNTLAHTFGPGTLTTWAAADEFICQITDSGELTDPLAGRIRPDPAATGRGRGLWVAHQVCDLLEVRSGRGGSLFRAHFRL